MRRKMLLLLTCLTSICTWAQDPERLFEKGNELYRSEQYNEALDVYHDILDEGYESAALYYNMGNAYYKTNQVGSAILYYEKAARLQPNDDEVRQNLEVARQATIDSFEEMPKPIMRAAWLAILQALRPGGWAVAALLAFALMLVGTFLYLFTAIRRTGFVAASTGFVAGVLCLVFAYGHQNYLEENKQAIVLASNSYVKSGPGERAEDVFILHEGTKVTITEGYEGWQKIRLPDGKVGWIKSDDVAVI